jgi:hypothetical protein
MKEGLPRSHAPGVLERRREDPLQFCMPVWISVASVSTFTCSTVGAARRSRSVRSRLMRTVCVD